MPPEHRFVWTLSGWPMAQILWPGQTPERRERIAQAIRDGRLVWHALPATLHTESLDLEDLVRGMGFSSRLSRQFGMPLPRDAKMTDVPCAHLGPADDARSTPASSSCTSAATRPARSPDVPPLFWWEGPDGSRAADDVHGGDYGTGLRPPAGWPYKTWLALIHTGDNHGPPTPDEVQNARCSRPPREMPGVKVRMGRLSDFTDAILKEKPDAAGGPGRHAGRLDPRHHVDAHGDEARAQRPPADRRAGCAEHAACGVGRRRAVEREDAVAAAYEGSLLYGEHTWGFDAKAFPRLYGKAWEEARPPASTPG